MRRRRSDDRERDPAKLVAELRARTGAGMMDCKKALEETAGDLEKAVDVLRTKGAAKADKRAGREASEGLIELGEISDAALCAGAYRGGPEDAVLAKL